MRTCTTIVAMAALTATTISTTGCASRPPSETADLVLLGGKIVTLDAEQAEVQALAARGGVIRAMGDDETVRSWIGPATRVIDLGGRLAVPGFIEGHGHLRGIGRLLIDVDLRSAATWDEVVARVAAAARGEPAGSWIRGRGWHQEKWSARPDPLVEGYPVHAALSAATPEHPVLLTHASGHATIVNAQAMALAGIDRNTRDPAGGQILRDGSGQPTGVLRERAADLAWDAYERTRAGRTPEEVADEAKREIRLAVAECLAQGITSFQDAGSSFETVDRMREMALAGALDVRLWVMLREDNAALRERIGPYRLDGVGDGFLTVRAIKRQIDGALGSHGAWLIDPYVDLPDSRGLNTIPLEELRETAAIALEHGFQLCVHAIGDRANRETLDVFEQAFASRPERGDLRWRVEHAQHLAPEDVPRFAELGVVASIQAVHCTSDGPWVPQRLGDARSRDGAYLWRKLLDSGAALINGTDAPVEDVDPIANFHASVTRRTAYGEPFYPEQCMTRMEALRSATEWPARAAFEESRKGTLAVGKYADLTVLSHDILTVPEETIRDAKVLYTIVGGRVRYESGAPAS